MTSAPHLMKNTPMLRNTLVLCALSLAGCKKPDAAPGSGDHHDRIVLESPCGKFHRRILPS